MTGSPQEGAATNIVSASGVMALGTLVSRLTGFARATLLAAAIGVSLHAEVFNVANTIPNSLYILVAGGVFNAVLVPQLVRAIRQDRDGGDAYANRVITLGAVVLAGVSAILVLLAPLLLRITVNGQFFTPGFSSERESLVDFARWCLPQIFFYGMFVLIGQILNARRRFGPMMWAPIANNVISIAVVVTYLLLYSGTPAGGGYSASQELLLGLGSTVGIAAQTAILLPYLRASGFTIKPRFDFRGTGLGHTLRLGMWTVGFVIVNQVAFYVLVNRATSGATRIVNGHHASSGFTVYSNAFLLTQVPHSIVTVSLATATMPLLAGLAADGRVGELATEIVRSLRLVLAVILPFAVALLMLGPELATVMFSWGAATGDTGPLGTTLVAFAPGLLMFTVHYMLLRGFYALEDTRTPFFIQTVIAGINAALAVTLTAVVPAQLVSPALALSYGIAYIVGASTAAVMLSRRVGGLAGRVMAAFVGRLALAAAPAGAAAYATLRGLERAGLDATTKPGSLLLLLAGGVVGLRVYLVLTHLLGVTEISRMLRLLRVRTAASEASTPGEGAG